MRKRIQGLAAAVLLLIASIIGANVLTSSSANAQTVVLPEFNVVATTPVPGSEVNRNQIPAATSVLDFRRYLLGRGASSYGRHYPRNPERTDQQR